MHQQQNIYDVICFFAIFFLQRKATQTNIVFFFNVSSMLNRWRIHWKMISSSTWWILYFTFYAVVVFTCVFKCLLLYCSILINISFDWLSFYNDALNFPFIYYMVTVRHFFSALFPTDFCNVSIIDYSLYGHNLLVFFFFVKYILIHFRW